MKKLTIAFDVDGTLIKDGAINPQDMVPNPAIRDMLIALSGFKNVRIVVWSGGGKDWADACVEQLDLKPYVKATYDKNLTARDKDMHPIFMPEIVPDIAIDDIHSCDLGKINLIVNK